MSWTNIIFTLVFIIFLLSEFLIELILILDYKSHQLVSEQESFLWSDFHTFKKIFESTVWFKKFPFFLSVKNSSWSQSRIWFCKYICKSSVLCVILIWNIQFAFNILKVFVSSWSFCPYNNGVIQSEFDDIIFSFAWFIHKDSNAYSRILRSVGRSYARLLERIGWRIMEVHFRRN